MDRRSFLLTSVAGGLAVPLAVEAQPAARFGRVGLLDPTAPGPSREYLWTAFRRRLAQLGYKEGDNVVFEFRSAHGKTDRLAALAAEITGHNVDVIVAASTPAALAAKRVTSSVPIVLTNSADPVRVGLVASLAHPGGNVTGVTTLSADLSVKRLEVLREIAPTADRIGVLWDETNTVFADAVRDTDTAAQSLGLQTAVFGIRAPADIEPAVLAMIRPRVRGLIVMPGPVIFASRRVVVELVAKHMFPAVYSQREFVDAGGLAAYGSNLAALFARAADFVAKILKGARPADLPVEQPTTFELIINLKTAKALGVTIPPSLLLRADHVIE